MASESEVRFTLKVMVNKEKTKVLFAIVDSDFADTLLSFLTLPLGKILRLLKKHYGDDEALPVFGSLSTLHKGLENLDSSYFCTDVGKQMLLDPRNPYAVECRALKLNIDDTHSTEGFICEDSSCQHKKQTMRLYHDTATCLCGKPINRAFFVNPITTGLVFTKKSLSFYVSDDLRMIPNTTGSFLQCLDSLGITETEGAEVRTVYFGLAQIMDLLKGSLFSCTPLTDIILNQGKIHNPFVPFPNKIMKKATNNNQKMVLKVVVQKSTNKFLFAQAEEDFVDFLFILLTLPLGQAQRIVGSETSSLIGSIDNLYKSVTKLNVETHLAASTIKGMLMNPELPPKYVSNNMIFSLTERNYIHNFKDDSQMSSKDIVSDPKAERSYVKGKELFMVTDDLTVTPLCLISRLSTLNEHNVHVSDVKEMDIRVGLEEGVDILRASFTSKCALSEGLNLRLNIIPAPKTGGLNFLVEVLQCLGIERWKKSGHKGYQKIMAD